MGKRVGKYVLGRTLGEGSFGKVKAACRADTGAGGYAVKIIHRGRVALHNHNLQIKREIRTLKLLRHPNVVRLYEVLASKTKIYMVLEHVTGGELFDKIHTGGRLSESEGRRLFQQLIDAVSYCHDKGVYHRDLKPENMLLSDDGSIKISDFGVSALPQQIGADGLLHTTCGSPNYIAPEVLANQGYDGAKSDIWSCGVILYVILTGCLPFDDDNLAGLYKKISKGPSATQIPKWLSSGARDMIKRMLDPNPQTRINMAQIKEQDWFKQGYSPAAPEDDDEDDMSSGDEGCAVKEVAEADELQRSERSYSHLNAFELIGMSSALDLSGLFEEEDVSERKIRFTSSCAPNELFCNIEAIATGIDFLVHKCNSKLKIVKHCKGLTSPQSVLIIVEVFELSPSLYLVELRKSSGDSSLYRKLCEKTLDELGVCKSQELSKDSLVVPKFGGLEHDMPISVASS